jgi:hypothetical protein
MSSRPTEEQISATSLEFITHPKFDQETADICGKFPGFAFGLEAAKKIMMKHFHPVSPQTVIAPGKIHRVKDCDDFVLWKLEVAVPGLKSNQSPRTWFAVRGGLLAFVVVHSHVENYDNNEMDRLAEVRAHDLF